jgi:hypothetical protein
LSHHSSRLTSESPIPLSESSDHEGRIPPDAGTVILQPVAMIIPNRYGVHSQNELKPQKLLTYEEFLSQYADHPRRIRICLDETVPSDTILQRSDLVTAYGSGLDCWYVVLTKPTYFPAMESSASS